MESRTRVSSIALAELAETGERSSSRSHLREDGDDGERGPSLEVC
jgi:hypothetical protein